MYRAIATAKRLWRSKSEWDYTGNEDDMLITIHAKKIGASCQRRQLV